MLAMTVERVERCDTRFEQCEEDDVELGNVGKLHQSRIPLADPTHRQPGGEIGGQPVQIDITVLPLTADDGGCIGLRIALFGKYSRKRLVEPVPLVAVALRPALRPSIEFNRFFGHSKQVSVNTSNRQRHPSVTATCAMHLLSCTDSLEQRGTLPDVVRSTAIKTWCSSQRWLINVGNWLPIFSFIMLN